MSTGVLPEGSSFRLRGEIGGADRTFYLAPGEQTVGSSPASDVFLAVAGVSREHAVLVVSAGGLVVEDRGSKNGTFVAGSRVERAGVPVDAELRFGPVRLVVERIPRRDAELGLEVAAPAPASAPEPAETAWIAEAEEPAGVELAFPPGYRPGTSRPMTALYKQLGRLAPGDLPVLVVGETGVGKDVAARILHASSARAAGPFVAVNCAAIPTDLQEAELFGIGSGVATGVQSRPGKFRLAAGGIIFLDEVGEMALPLQAKLLRALQDKEIQPLGGPAEAVDVRIVAATNADLAAKIQGGDFRSDLYYRLAGYVLEVPPLRHCAEDVRGLVEHFLRRYGGEAGVRVRGVTVAALERLESYGWPGNVRELAHEMRRLVYLSSDGQVIDTAMLSPSIRDGAALPAGAPAAQPLALEPQVRELETRLIREALRRAGGVHLQAARLLGIHRNSLRHKMKRLGIEG